MAGIKNENYAKCKALLLGLIAASLVSLIFPWFPFPSESCALGQLVDAGGGAKNENSFTCSPGHEQRPNAMPASSPGVFRQAPARGRIER
jgi:hypothetical protein